MNKTIIVKSVSSLSFNQNIKTTCISVFNITLRKSKIPIYFEASPRQDDVKQVVKFFF